MKALLYFIWGFTSAIKLYIRQTNNSEQISDGSSEKPFKYLSEALLFLDGRKNFFELDTNEIIIDDAFVEEDLSSDANKNVQVFREWRILNLSVSGRPEKSTLKFISLPIFYINSGFLYFYNIEFKKSDSIHNEEKLFSLVEYSREGSFGLYFRSCKFADGRSMEAGDLFYMESLIKIIIEQDKKVNKTYLTINLENAEFLNTYFKGNLVYLPPNEIDSEILYKLMLINIRITYNTNKIRPESYEKSKQEFLFMINSCNFIFIGGYLENPTRLVLASFSNVVILNQINIKSTFELKYRPEMVYLLNYNYAELNMWVFNNYTVGSRDDLVNIEKDDVMIDPYTFSTTNIFEHEKTQGIIKVLKDNQIHLMNFELNNVNLIKYNNLYFAFLVMGTFNLGTLNKVLLNNTWIDSQNSFGLCMFIFLQEKNKIELKNIVVYSPYLNTYSIALFLGAILGNQVDFHNSIFNYSFLKHKSTQKEVLGFYDFAEKLGNNIQVFLTLKTEKFKISSFFAFMGYNQVLINETVFESVQCLGNCVIISLTSNSFTLISVIMRKLESSLMSSGFLILHKTYLSLTKTDIINSISIGGPLLCYHINIIIIFQCTFFENIALSVIGKESFATTMIAGSLYLGQNNSVSISYTSFNASKTDTFGGGLTTYLFNNVSFEQCTFIDVESINKNSKGSVIMLFEYNRISFKNVKFLRTLGYLGAILYANYSDHILFDNCLFNDSIGIDGGAFYLNDSATLTLKGCIFQAITSNSSGVLMANYTGHKILIYNCSLLGNGINLKDTLFKLDFGNSITLDAVIIDYQINIGVGSLINCDKGNYIRIVNSKIINANDLYSLIHTSRLNKVFIIGSTFEGINSEILSADMSNEIKISQTKIVKCYPIDKKSVIINLKYYNNLSIDNTEISNSEGAEGAIIYSIESNIVIIDSVIAKTISSKKLKSDDGIGGGGGAFYFIYRNKIMINNSIFEDFTGEGSSLVLSINWNNDLDIYDSSFNGSVSGNIYTDISNIKGVFFIYGMFNSLNIQNNTVNQKVVLLKAEDINFLYLKGENSLISISNSNFSLQNHSSFLKALGNNVIKINCSIFYNSITLGYYINLEKTQLLMIKGTTFINMNRKSENSIFYIKNNNKTMVSGCFFIDNERIFYFIESNISINRTYFRNSKIIERKTVLNIFISTPIFISNTEFISTGNPDSINILAENCSIALIKNTFLLNKGVKGGVFYLRKVEKGEIIKNIFLNNNGGNGGIFYIEDSFGLKIVNNKFVSNSAFKDQNFYNSRGGCFFFNTSAEKVKTWTVVNNSFSGNKANAGGVYFLVDESLSLKLQKNTYQKNKGKHYGDIYASDINEIYLLPGEDFYGLKTRQIFLTQTLSISNDTSQKCLAMIIASDHFDQIMKDTALFKETNIDFMGMMIAPFPIFRGCPCMILPSVALNVTSFDFPVTKPTTLTISPNQFSENLHNTDFNDSLVALEVKFFLRNCDIGEYLDTKLMQCKPCQINFYSFEKNISKASSCLSCLNKEFYCYGANDLSPKKGFWRLNESVFNFFECPNKEACLGDSNMLLTSYPQIVNENYLLTSPSGFCAYKYKGALCEKCIYGFTKSSAKKCVPCGSLLEIILLIIKIIGRLFIYFYMVYKAFNLSKNIMRRRVEKNIVILNFLIKIFIGHLQFIRLLLVIFPIEYPAVIQEIIGFITSSIISDSNSSFGLDCLGVDKYFPAKYLKNISNLAMPLLTVMIVKLYGKLNFRKIFYCISRRRKSSEKEFKRNSTAFTYTMEEYSSFYSTFSICTMIMFDPIIISLAENFHELNVGDENFPEFRIVSDLEIESRSGFHLFWKVFIATPLIVIFGAFIPLALLYKIAKHKNKKIDGLDNPLALFRYGYFYYAYDRKFYFYETFYIGRKLVIIVIDVFFARTFFLDSKYKPLTFLIILMVFFVVTSLFSLRSKPFDRHKYDLLNRIEYLSFIVQALTCALGCFYLSLETKNGESPSKIVIIMTYASVIIASTINIFYAGFWFRYFWRSLKSSSTYLVSKFISAFKTVVKWLPGKKNIKSYENTLLETSLRKKTKKFDANNLIEVYEEKIKNLTILNNLLIEQIKYLEESKNNIKEADEEASFKKLPNRSLFVKFRSDCKNDDKPPNDNLGGMDSPTPLTGGDLLKIPSESSFEAELLSKGVEGDNFSKHFVNFKYMLVDREINYVRIKEFDSDHWVAIINLEKPSGTLNICLRLMQNNPNLLHFMQINIQLEAFKYTNSGETKRLYSNLTLYLDASTFFSNKSQLLWKTNKTHTNVANLLLSYKLKESEFHYFWQNLKKKDISFACLELRSPFLKQINKEISIEINNKGVLKIYGVVGDLIEKYLKASFDEFLMEIMNY